MQLAYVFWHWPADGADRQAYEERMRAFHAALGLDGSRTYRLDRAPWDGRPPEPYEDWYPVEGWPQLGALNERAVSGARKASHDAAATGAGEGAGGVYRLVRDGTEEVVAAHWLAKPAGATYDAFVPELLERAGGAAVWQRQMVLGPAPEFVVLGAQALDLPWPATVTAPRSL